jgi:quercetin dioxygenase-like cupin family protein
VKRSATIAFLPLLLLATCTAQQAPVPVEQEPYHHVVLKNEEVIVMHPMLGPGEHTAYHIHACNRAGVELSANTVVQQRLNEPEGKPQKFSPGDVFSDACFGQPLVHRVINVGTTTMDVIDVEFLQKPASPSTSVAGPIAAENASARMYKWVIAPGTATTMHTHTRPYLIVAATPMNLKMTAPDGQFRAEQVKAGDFHWITVPVTHSLANDGTAEGQIVEFELK